MRRPVGKLPGIYATTPLTYKYAHDRGQVFTPRWSFSTVPAKTSLSILEVKFLNALASKVHTFSVYRGSMRSRISNMRHRTSSTPAPPPPLPPFMRIDWIWWIHVLEVQMYLLIFDCMTSNFICLGFTTLRSSSSWRIDTVIFAKLNKPLLPHQTYLKEISPGAQGAL